MATGLACLTDELMATQTVTLMEMSWGQTMEMSLVCSSGCSMVMLKVLSLACLMDELMATQKGMMTEKNTVMHTKHMTTITYFQLLLLMWLALNLAIQQVIIRKHLIWLIKVSCIRLCMQERHTDQRVSFLLLLIYTPNVSGMDVIFSGGILLERAKDEPIKNLQKQQRKKK